MSTNELNRISIDYEQESDAPVYTMPDEVCCSPEFPQGCVFND